MRPMNNNLLHIASCSLFLLTSAVVACEETALIENQRTFSDTLAAELYENENECTSMLGASMALSLVYPGSTGNAKTQMESILGYPEGAAQEKLVWKETVHRLTTRYNGDCLLRFDENCEDKKPTLSIANSIWIDTSTKLKSTYRELVGEYVKSTDFTDDAAGGVVNKWVQNTTNGLIDSIIEDGPISLELLALNSIYLSASWRDSFEKSMTNKDLFYSSTTWFRRAAETTLRRRAETETEAHFMHKVGYFDYSHTALPGFQLLRLPFLGNTLSMLIALPLSDASGVANSTSVLEVFDLLERTYVALALPKFMITSEFKENLKESLKKIGLTAPFSGGFCNMFDDDGKCGFIDLIAQKTHLAVFEQGIEAAAQTVVGMDRSEPPAPVLIMADHPFYFFIYDEVEQLSIFEGRVGNPGIPEDAEEAELQAWHDDADFWQNNFWVDPIVVDGTSPRGGTNEPTSTEPPIFMEPTGTDRPTGIHIGPLEEYQIPASQMSSFEDSAASTILQSWIAVLVGVIALLFR